MLKVLIILCVTINFIIVSVGITSANTSANTCEVGNFVWNDLNSNGIQDHREPGIAGVTVFLEDSNYKQLQSTITDSSGMYLFTGLEPDKYVLYFIAPDGTSFTLKKQGSDLTMDSNANPKGHSDFFTLTTKHPVNLNIDAGLTGSPVPLPSTVLLMSSGLLGMVGLRRRFWKL
jgi:hypothetical protein